jgi:hypothetical protein
VKLSRLRRPKAACSLSSWNIDLIKMQQYYETLVTLRGGHVQEGYSKRRKLRS